jgi:hypothetical protein
VPSPPGESVASLLPLDVWSSDGEGTLDGVSVVADAPVDASVDAPVVDDACRTAISAVCMTAAATRAMVAMLFVVSSFVVVVVVALTTHKAIGARDTPSNVRIRRFRSVLSTPNLEINCGRGGGALKRCVQQLQQGAARGPKKSGAKQRSAKWWAVSNKGIKENRNVRQGSPPMRRGFDPESSSVFDVCCCSFGSSNY